MTDTIITRNADQMLVRPAGDVVAALVPDLRTTLRKAVAEGAQQLTIDFSNVQMVDSVGIGLLISAHNSMRRMGGRLAVIHASSEIQDLFKSMRIHQHFSISEDSAEAR